MGKSNHNRTSKTQTSSLNTSTLNARVGSIQGSEDLCIYLLVRRDLKMPKGKIAAQCGHAIEALVLACPKNLLKAYQFEAGSRKICLSITNEEELDSIQEKVQSQHILYHKVKDAGLTCVKPGTCTVLGLGPVRSSSIREIIGDLKLL